MPTGPEESASSFAAALSNLDIGALLESGLLVLAGLCAIAATVILVSIAIVAPIRGVSSALGDFIAWLKETDWKPIRSLLLVMAMLAAIGLTSVLGAKAIYHANQFAETLLISILGLGLIVGGWYILWRLARRTKRAATQMVRDNSPQPEEAGP